MKKLTLIGLCCLQSLLSVAASNGGNWGFFAHKRINRMAVFTLPSKLMGFYKPHLDYVTDHAVDPDKRRHAVSAEPPRHYIDIDYYAHHGKDPFKIMPRRWDKAVEKFTEDTLQAYGIVPWHINLMKYQLTKAFKEKDQARVLKLSADIGHYIGDAHVPLHTTENYNGQLTGQKGIHGFWESRLPELFAEKYDYWLGRAEYIERPLDYIWEVVEESHSHVDSVLLMEKAMSQEWPSDQQKTFEQRGQSTVSQYSRPYSKAYHERMDGMVEQRLRSAIFAVGSFWYTCWVDAGKPDMRDSKEQLDPKEEFEKELEALNKAYRENKNKGREHGE